MEITEAQKKTIIEKLEFIQKSLPTVLEAAKEGKITSVPHEKMFIVEPPVQGLTSVNVKEFTVIFIRCPGEEIEQNRSLD